MNFSNLDAETARFYRAAMRALAEADVPFLVGGAYAYAHYTHIKRHTKDLDLFVAANVLEQALDVLDREGFATELTHAHWLAKALLDGDSIDLIFASGNGVTRVDETWMAHAEETEILDVPVRLCPAEEMLCTKAFVMERERYDGADVAHLLRDRADAMNWNRLLELFGPHWRVLYSHLILFGFIYPSKRHLVPDELMAELARRLEREQARPPLEEPLCRGTLLSRAQYLPDVNEDGYVDARRWPEGTMTGTEIERWTRDMKRDGPTSERDAE